MKGKKILVALLAAILVVGVGVGGYFGLKDNDKDKEPKTEEKVKDNEKFAKEYTKISKDNVFVYRTMDEVIKILEKGTGIVYLGFPECPWCQAYVPYLNEVAKENKVEKIYYKNISQERKDNTKEYQKIMELLGKYVEYDDEGNKRIYAPTIIFVKDGKIIGMDSETAKDTKGCKDPEEYWTEKRLKALKKRLNDLASEVSDRICSDCNK